MPKILITGGSGFIGHNLVEFFVRRFDTVATYHSRPPNGHDLGARFVQLDVREEIQVRSVVEQERPDVLIHAAGDKNVRRCKSNPDEAHLLNALGARNVARACEKFGARMIYVSTDLVFDGSRGAYREDETPIPTTVYGRTKLDGERYAMEECSNTAICRTGGVYGPGSPLLEWFAKEVSAGRSVEAFTDVFNSPTYAMNLAEMIDVTIQRGLTRILHTAGSERIDRFHFFREYARQFGFDETVISPASRNADDADALLQHDSSLATGITASKLDLKSNTVADGFARMKEHGGT